MAAGDISSQLRASGLRVVVTGVSGWLGRASLGLLRHALGDGWERRVLAFGSYARRISLSEGHGIDCQPLSALCDLPQGRYLFLHYAFLTKERVDGLSTEDYVRANSEISEAVEAAMRRVETVGAFVPSSGAVYGPGRALNDDLASNSYGAMKLADERRFSALAEELGFRLSLIRVFNLAGPHINKVGSYALASIINDILNDRPIVLRADHPVIRSYIHVGDLIGLALASLLDVGAPNLPAFDTAGEVEVEVGDLARQAAEVLDKPGLPIERPAIRKEPANRYVGDPATLRALCAHYGIELRPLAEQIRDTAAGLAVRPIA